MLKPFRMLSASVLAFATVLSACGGDDDGGTEPPPPALSAPTGLTVTATSAFTAHVTWTAVSSATSYVVQRATGATGTNFESVGTATSPSFDDSGLNPESQYRYRVASVAGTTSSDFSSEATVTTPIAPVATVEVTSDITSNTLWTQDKVYILKGFIHVGNGATLT